MESVPIDSPVLGVEAWVISELGDVTNKVEVSLACSGTNFRTPHSSSLKKARQIYLLSFSKLLSRNSLYYLKILSLENSLQPSK